MKDSLARAQALKNTLVADRRHLHTIPELAHELPQTTAYVKKRLTEMGYEPKTIGTAGVIALAGGKKGGKVILLRADMDALPIQEESGLPFASTNGNCHACGHDLHTSMLLGAAAILKDIENELEGTVKLVFQPAEEALSGATSLIEAGIMEGPHVDANFAMHVAAEFPVGTFGYNFTYPYASADTFQIDIQGKGAHGAMPHLGVDPINVAAHIHIALQEILAREVSAYDTLVITVGKLVSGHAMNIIPDTAEMLGSIRAYSADVRTMAVRRLQEIAEHTAKAFNATAKTTIRGSIPSLRCDEDMVRFMLQQLEGADIPNAVIRERRSMGSEDFAFFAELAPTAFLSLGGGLKDESKRLGLHNPKILFDEDCLPYGAAAHVAMAKNWLASNR